VYRYEQGEGSSNVFHTNSHAHPNSRCGIYLPMSDADYVKNITRKIEQPETHRHSSIHPQTMRCPRDWVVYSLSLKWFLGSVRHDVARVTDRVARGSLMTPYVPASFVPACCGGSLDFDTCLFFHRQCQAVIEKI